MVKFKDAVFAAALEVCWLFGLWLSICSASLSI